MLESVKSFFNPEFKQDDSPMDLYVHSDPIAIAPAVIIPDAIPKPIKVGYPSHRAQKGDVIVDEELDRLESFLSLMLESPLGNFFLTAEELCIMPKAVREACAIPHPSLWWNFVPLILYGWYPIRTAMDMPLEGRFYRPFDYNKAVGGVKGSMHMFCKACDIHLLRKHNNSINRDKLARAGATNFLNHGASTKMEFGIYGTIYDPTSIHVATGYKTKTYGAAGAYVKRVKPA
jgi:hypothetical protein